jgi:hypothetical protein
MPSSISGYVFLHSPDRMKLPSKYELGNTVALDCKAAIVKMGGGVEMSIEDVKL